MSNTDKELLVHYINDKIEVRDSITQEVSKTSHGVRL